MLGEYKRGLVPRPPLFSSMKSSVVALLLLILNLQLAISDVIIIINSIEILPP